MARDAITLITQDHRKLEELFERLRTETDQRPRLLDEVEALLTSHSRAEEEKVYPVIVQELEPDEEIHHGVEEHHEAEELLERLRECDPAGGEFDGRLEEFVDVVRQHVQEEEEELLPALKQAVGQKRLEELGEGFAERREEEMQHFQVGAERIPKQRELYEEAERLDIKRRSQMNREELAEAIAQAKQR